ncbi:flavin reductase [Lachnospiraceae bacterium OttesenSCG-928-D06]|nr:flavin reductase [Lachnospiraceae bacterium OttesenSCG-928-D06]
MGFQEIKPEELMESACKLIGKDWMLITAGTERKINTMTASWGGLGEIWGVPAAYVMIRPQRYTKEFVDAQETMSLTFYEEEYRDKLAYLGMISGRDENKIKNAELTTVFDQGTPYFAEARAVMIVRKMYEDTFKRDGFVDLATIKTHYAEGDYHTMYICKIEKVLIKK